MQIIYLHPHFTAAGGAGRAVLETGTRLARRGHDVHCVCIRADPMIVGPAESAIEFHEIGGRLSSSLGFWIGFRSSCRQVCAAVDRIIEPAASPILFPQVFPANWWANDVIKQFPDLPCCWYCQEPSAFIHSRSWISALPRPKNWIATVLQPLLSRVDIKKCRAFEHVLVNSDFSSQYTRQVYGYHPDVCATVYLGVDHNRFEHRGRSGRQNEITTIAKLTRFKNVDQIIRAMAILVEQGRVDLRLNIVGEGDAREELQQLRDRLRLTNHVVFHGRASDTAMLKLLQRSKVFCLASVTEPFGLVTLEALACGTPVVAVDSGGPREVLAGQSCGVLVPTAEPSELAKGIAQILDSGNQFAELSARAVQRASEFSWDATVDRLETVFASVSRRR